MISAEETPLFARDSASVWRPNQAAVERSRLASFLREHNMDDLATLHRRAIEDPEFYWRATVENLEIKFERPFARVLQDNGTKEFPRWFVGGSINLAANCLDRFAEGSAGQKPAIIWEAESGQMRSMSYGELHREAVRFARYLRSIGVNEGDRVALFMPMIPEAVAAFFGCARVGAVIVPVFSGYGPDALASRLHDSDAVVLVTADGFRRKGSVVWMKEVTDRAVAEAHTVRSVVMVPHMGLPIQMDGRTTSWSDALAVGDESPVTGECVFLEPNQPLMIMYTSGTTGRPKGIVHSHGGFLVKAGHDFGYAFDVQGDDTVFWITDIGWIMGPLLMVGVLMFHATAVLYEGAPDYPDPGRVWEIVERHKVTFLGISPTAVRTLAAAGDQWIVNHQLSSLRAFASTGEPWNEGPWRWLFERVGGGRVPILNYTGGTEIGGGILTCYTLLPLKPCAFAGPVIGMDVDVVDDKGGSLRGEIGELIIRNTWPGMTNGFWKDRDRYLEAYWGRFPGIWVHGDLAVVDHDGYWYVTGRSDDTIKLAGRRVGPAEVESALVAHPAVKEAAAVGVPDVLKGQVLICFVVLVAGTVPRPELEQEIRAVAVDRLGKALAPQKVIFVEGLPKTRNGKIVRRVIRARYLGLPLGDVSSIEDLGSLDLIPEANQ